MDRGFAGDGTTSYIETGFNPSTAPGANFQQDSACIAVRCDISQAGGNNIVEMGNGGPGSILQFRSGGNRTVARINNNASFLSDTSFVNSGFAIASRSGPTTSRLYRSLLGVSNDSNASTGVGTASFIVGGNIVSGVPTPSSTKRVNAYAIGGAITSQQNTDFQNIMNAYMNAVGVV